VAGVPPPSSWPPILTGWGTNHPPQPHPISIAVERTGVSSSSSSAGAPIAPPVWQYFGFVLSGTINAAYFYVWLQNQLKEIEVISIEPLKGAHYRYTVAVAGAPGVQTEVLSLKGAVISTPPVHTVLSDGVEEARERFAVVLEVQPLRSPIPLAHA